MSGPVNRTVHLRLDLRDLRKSIGRNIMNMRRVRRMRLAALSKATGVSMEKLDRWEMGKGEIDLLNLVRIADALKVSPGELVGHNGPDGERRAQMYEMSEFFRELSESRNYDFSLSF